MPADMHLLRPKSQFGISLIELMIALVVGLILMTGTLQLLLSSRQSYRTNEQLARLQDSGHFAMHMLAQDLRMSGYQGCADPGSGSLTNIVKNQPPTTDLSQTAVGGTEGGADPDSISVQHASEDSVGLAANSDPTNASVPIVGNPQALQPGEVVILGDCQTAHLLRITNDPGSGSPATLLHASSENLTGQLTKVYAPPLARVMRFESNTYTIANSGKTNKVGDPIPALVRAGAVLVEGVENMQILYGERSDTGDVRYVKADNASLDMSRVTSVRIGLLVSTVDPVLQQGDDGSYEVAGTTIAPEGTSGATATHPVDRRMRRVFLSTVRLRNRR
jgi:type IV pilus assembly protein PilW